MTVVVVIVLIVVVAVVVGASLRNRGASDGVDSFRRQIDALSPEARKPTVDQVKSAERSESGSATDRGAGDDRTDPDGSGDLTP